LTNDVTITELVLFQKYEEGGGGGLPAGYNSRWLVLKNFKFGMEVAPKS